MDNKNNNGSLTAYAKKSRIKNPVLWILISLAVVSLDQISKYLAVVYLQPLGSVPFIKNLLDFTFVVNRGAAFGILSDHRWVYISISILAILAMICILLFYAERTVFLEIAVALMLGGGIGNMIDRLLLGYVIDFLEFPFVNFAIFNIADSCVCVGAVLMSLYMIKHEFKKDKAHAALSNKAKDDTHASAPTDDDEG